MKDKLLIIGASGHGKVVADMAIKMNKWQEIAFLDDNENIKETMGIKVLGNTKKAFDYIDNYDFFVAIGNNKTRNTIQAKLKEYGANIATLIHPTAVIGKDVIFGVGTVVMAGVVINCCSQIGEGVIINTSSSIDHDCIIEDYAHISPGVNIAGTVEIGKLTWLGIGSVVSNNIDICDNCILGAGTVVVKDINEVGTYVGAPARRVG